MNTKRPALYVVIAFGLLIVAFIIAFYTVVLLPLKYVTNPARYQEVLAERWSFPEATSHFPKAVPPDASHVKFLYAPPGFHRDTYLQLRYTLPPDAVTALDEEYNAVAKYSFAGGISEDHAAEEPGVFTTYFFTGNWIFPKDYTILVLWVGELPRPGTTYKGSAGVAISKTRNDVVFWATVI
ncbi:MAG: hypothetical protein KJZ78_13525 [Bryobacteraceae bacterium]|nr:hypothetical protein [Bryobacteraceae bacterium]